MMKSVDNATEIGRCHSGRPIARPTGHRRGAQKNLAAAVEIVLLRTNYDRAVYSGIREITSSIARCVGSRSMAHLWHTVGELVFNWFTDSSRELVDDRGVHQRGQKVAVVPADRSRGLSHKDDGELLFRIDPPGGAIGA